MKRNFLKMNLQLFAEPGDDNPESTPPAFNVDELTDEQIAAIKEKHSFKTDDDVNDIVRNKKSRWKIDSERELEEAVRTALLPKDKREQEAEDKRLKEINEREADITRRELRAESIGRLSEADLPIDLVDALNLTSEEDCNKSFELIKTVWEKANGTYADSLADAVNEKLKGSTINPLGESTQTGTQKIKNTLNQHRIIK